jgi:oligoendopeptidase F
MKKNLKGGKKFIVSPWDLKDIKPSSLNVAFKSIDKKVAALERKRKFLKNSISAKTFMNIIQDMESLRVDVAKLGCFAGLRFAEDSTNQKAVAEMTAIETFQAKLSNRLLFFSLWFKDLPAKKATELIKASGKYHYYLQQVRKTKPYTLKENEEKIINIKDLTGVSALNNVYNILTSQFEFQFQGKTLTREELVSKVRDPSPKVREQAYLTLLSRFKENKDVIGEIYKTIINDWREESIGLRGYETPIQVRNVANDIPDKAIESLLKVCERNEKLFHRFFEIKRKKLGLKKMRRFDIYAPVASKKEEKIPYDTAVKMVLDCYSGFSQKFTEGALQIFNSGHVHSNIQKGKQSGAFCCSVTTKMPPYILLNYTGELRDVSTIAHEFGHGVHHILASCQTEFTHSSCLPLAETASIFGEMLLSEKIMEKDPKKAKELMFFKLEDIYASIIRQAGFCNFEKKAHQMMKEGKTIDDMSKVYITDLKKQLGPRIDVDDIYAYEWAYIPHIFHTPFYVYAYVFGNLLTLALWEMYKENGQPFAEKIIKMLEKGGSESPIAVTKAVGVDITSEKFWQKGFDVIEKMIRKVE